MKSGISRRQGGHQVAQKLMTRTLPLKSARVRVLPWRSRTEKSGAGTAGAVCSAGRAQATTAAASVRAAVHMSIVRTDLLILRRATLHQPRPALVDLGLDGGDLLRRQVAEATLETEIIVDRLAVLDLQVQRG